MTYMRKTNYHRYSNAVRIITVFLSLFFLISGCTGKHGFRLSDVTVVEIDQIYHNRYNTRSFEIQTNGLNMAYWDTGKAYKGTLGEYVGETDFPGHDKYPVHFPEKAQDSLTVIVSEEGQNELYYLGGVQRYREGTLGEILNLYGYDQNREIDRISFSFERKGIDDPVETGAVTKKKELKTLLSELGSIPSRTDEQYLLDIAKTGEAGDLEGIDNSSAGMLRRREIRISWTNGKTLLLLFDPVSGYITGANGHYKTEDMLKEKLIRLAGINMDESYYIQYAKKQEASMQAMQKLHNKMSREDMEIKDGGFYGGSYLDGADLVVYLTEDTEENRLYIEGVAGTDQIKYIKAKHTYSELYTYRGLITKDQLDGKLPFVSSKFLDEKANCISVEITEMNQEYLDILSSYDPEGDWMKIVYVSDITDRIP